MQSTNQALLLLDHIGNELKLLWWQMDAYQELFLIEKQRRQSLLQNTAPGFFTVAQVSFSESVLMRVFRLMDPTKSCGNENSSIQHLHDTLSENDMAQKALRSCISSIGTDWQEAKKNKGPYVALKTIRDKLLAHNDFSERGKLDKNQLWMNLSPTVFESAQNLAGRLWAMYRHCNLVLRNADVVEPTHATLDNRPSVLLKHLCASRYLDSVMADMPEHASRLEAKEAEEMGDDNVRRVFATEDATVARCSAVAQKSP